MAAARHCEECWAVLDPSKILRCTKCKACFYCSRACQTRNWRLHKRVCSTDPLLRRFVPVEMAVERALAKQKVQAPKDATYYICLEGDGDGKSSKLMRGCACRGDSAGFVHLECLTELAISKEASGDFDALLNGWTTCGNCKQSFVDVLELELDRRFWRRYRSSPDLYLRYHSTRILPISLWNNGEFDVANQLLDAVSTCVANEEVLMDLKLLRAVILEKKGESLVALGLLQAMLPEAKEFSTAHPGLYVRALTHMSDVLLELDRHQEAHEAVTELVAFAKAKFGLENPRTLNAMESYAVTCAKLGRDEEAKATFEDVLTTETRVFGRDHPYTQETRQSMRTYGFAEPSG